MRRRSSNLPSHQCLKFQKLKHHGSAFRKPGFALLNRDYLRFGRAVFIEDNLNAVFIPLCHEFRACVQMSMCKSIAKPANFSELIKEVGALFFKRSVRPRNDFCQYTDTPAKRSIRPSEDVAKKASSFPLLAQNIARVCL